MPSVSIIIPTYNNASYLSAAVESVRNQTYRDFEAIIVDDGSGDGTWKVMREPVRKDRRFRYIFQDNRGPSAARNRGMREAQGKYIAFLDADDLWSPRKLERQMAAFVRDRTLGFAYCDVMFVDNACREIRDYIRKIRLVSGNIAAELFSEFFIITSTLVMRASCRNAIGYFREDMRVGEDYEYFMKLAYRYRGEAVGEKLLFRRVRANSLSRQDAVADAVNDLRTLTEFAGANPDFYARNRHAVDRRLSACHCALGYLYMNRGLKLRALRHQACSLRYHFNTKAFKRLLMSLAPPRLLSLARQYARPGQYRGAERIERTG